MVMQTVQATQEVFSQKVSEARTKLDGVLNELNGLFEKLKTGEYESKEALAPFASRISELLVVCEGHLQDLLKFLREAYEQNVSEENRKQVEKYLKNVRDTVEKALQGAKCQLEGAKAGGAKAVGEVAGRMDELTKMVSVWTQDRSEEISTHLEKLQKNIEPHVEKARQYASDLGSTISENVPQIEKRFKDLSDNVKPQLANARTQLNNYSPETCDKLTAACDTLVDTSLPFHSRFFAFISLIFQAFFVLMATIFTRVIDSPTSKKAAAKKDE